MSKIAVKKTGEYEAVTVYVNEDELIKMASDMHGGLTHNDFHHSAWTIYHTAKGNFVKKSCGYAASDTGQGWSHQTRWRQLEKSEVIEKLMEYDIECSCEICQSIEDEIEKIKDDNTI